MLEDTRSAPNWWQMAKQRSNREKKEVQSQQKTFLRVCLSEFFRRTVVLRLHMHSQPSETLKNLERSLAICVSKSVCTPCVRQRKRNVVFFSLHLNAALFFCFCVHLNVWKRHFRWKIETVDNSCVGFHYWIKITISYWNSSITSSHTDVTWRFQCNRCCLAIWFVHISQNQSEFHGKCHIFFITTKIP